MSDEPSTTTSEPGPPPVAAQPATGDGTDWKVEAEKWQALARKHEDRAKANAGAAGELDKFRKAAMTEQERAVAEAEARGKTAAIAESAGRLARAEFRAAAAGRLSKEALDGFLEYADPAKFVDANGEPDAKAIEAVVKRLAGPDKPTNFDGGARTPAAKTTDMNQLIRERAGYG
jgi:hypothetical protein